MATTATKFNVATRIGVPFRTSNSDLQRAATFETRSNKVYWVEFKAIAYRTQDNSQAASYWRQACFRTSATGTITQVGATRTVVTDNEDAGGWQFVLGTAGTNLTLDVAGEGSPCDWLIRSDIQEWDNTQIT